MTTPPLTCPVVTCRADTHDLTEHLYDHSAGVLAHTLAGAGAEFARLEEVIAKQDTTLAQVRAERDRLRAELVGAKATLDHMTQAMSWLSGHDRQGLDHLADAMRETKAREHAVEQAKNWATRARTAEAALADARNTALTEGGALLLHKRAFLNDVADPAEQAAALLLATLTAT